MSVCFDCNQNLHMQENAVPCDACGLIFCGGCLCEEGEDGRLCKDCSDFCPNCNMTINADLSASDHIGDCAVCKKATCEQTFYGTWVCDSKACVFKLKRRRSRKKYNN